jgi:hypothetical protein
LLIKECDEFKVNFLSRNWAVKNNCVYSSFFLALHVHVAREVSFFGGGSVLVDQIANDFTRSVELHQVVLEHVMLSERLGVSVTLLHLVEVHRRSMKQPRLFDI